MREIELGLEYGKRIAMVNIIANADGSLIVHVMLLVNSIDLISWGYFVVMISKKLSAVALAIPLLSGSLLMGAGTANAAECPVGQHWNEMGGGAGFCAMDPSGGGTGGDSTIDLGGQTNTTTPVAPEFPAPAPYVPPSYGIAPAAPIIAQPAPAPAPVAVPQKPVTVAPQPAVVPRTNVAPVSGATDQKVAIEAPASKIDAPQPVESKVAEKAKVEAVPQSSPLASHSPSATPEPSASLSLDALKAQGAQEASSNQPSASNNTGSILVGLGVAFVVIGGVVISLMIRNLKPATARK
jgi:hypothetical protein